MHSWYKEREREMEEKRVYFMVEEREREWKRDGERWIEINHSSVSV